MPDITIINDLNEDIHVAFFLGVPCNWKNDLKPGERWTTHTASLPLHFEVRWVQRVDFDTGNVWRSREFSHDESMEMLATIGGACAAGTASVVSAGALVTGDMIAGVPMIAGIPMISWPLMNVACAGESFSSLMLYHHVDVAKYPGGSKYGTWGADGRLCTARVWVPFRNKEYSVRIVEGRGCVLWDIGDNRPV